MPDTLIPRPAEKGRESYLWQAAESGKTLKRLLPQYFGGSGEGDSANHSIRWETGSQAQKRGRTDKNLADKSFD